MGYNTRITPKWLRPISYRTIGRLLQMIDAYIQFIVMCWQCSFECSTYPGSPSGVPQVSPRCPPGVPRSPSGVPRSPPGVPQESPGVPRSPPGVPQESPGVPQESPGVPRSPSGVPRSPQESFRSPKEFPGVPQESTRSQPGVTVIFMTFTIIAM